MSAPLDPKATWATHAPDLVRDNRLMHERIPEQNREIERLRELLRRVMIHEATPGALVVDIEHAIGERP